MKFEVGPGEEVEEVEEVDDEAIPVTNAKSGRAKFTVKLVVYDAMMSVVDVRVVTREDEVRRILSNDTRTLDN